MKSLIVAVALVGPALAQSVPACVTNCLNNMLAKASELGCPGAQAACLCSKIDFGYGVRDCSTESCPPGTDFSGLPALAVKYCGSTTVAALQPFLAATGSGAASGTASASAGAKTPAITTEAVVTTFTSDGKTITSTVGSKTVYTSPLVSTYTSDGKTFTTTYGTTTITGGTGAAASASESASAALASAKSSASAAVSSVASSASSALASASSSASSAGALPMATLAIQSFAGVAGIAAMLAL